jgi:hypothetical protein
MQQAGTRRRDAMRRVMDADDARLFFAMPMRLRLFASAHQCSRYVAAPRRRHVDAVAQALMRGAKQMPMMPMLAKHV